MKAMLLALIFCLAGSAETTHELTAEHKESLRAINAEIVEAIKEADAAQRRTYALLVERADIERDIQIDLGEFPAKGQCDQVTGTRQVHSVTIQGDAVMVVKDTTEVCE